MSVSRPVLSPALTLLWRADGTAQVGRSAEHATVLRGDPAALRPLLRRLDGTRSRAQLLEEDPGVGVALDALECAGLLLDADDLSPRGLERDERERLGPDVASLSLVHGRRAAHALLARRSARVVVHGAGRVGAPLAALLSAAGVGAVDVLDDGPARLSDTTVGGLRTDDVGRPRGTAVSERLPARRSPAPVDLGDLGDVVILTDGTDPVTTQSLRRSATPHLVAEVVERTGTVGPFVLPGSSCLTCLDLTRRSLDPGWAAALPDRRPVTSACDGVLAMAVAAQAALQVLEQVEGGHPATVDGTLELTLPGWAWRRRSWPRHPGCACAWDSGVRVA